MEELVFSQLKKQREEERNQSQQKRAHQKNPHHTNTNESNILFFENSPNKNEVEFSAKKREEDNNFEINNEQLPRINSNLLCKYDEVVSTVSLISTKFSL
jgi:hypothetical protein